jgi:hypothetical protein
MSVPTTLFSIPNMASSEAERLDLDTAPLVRLPAFADKPAYRKWCNDRDTKHAFVSGIEGLTPGLRITEQNPPAKLWTLIGEYDAAFDPKVNEVTVPPTWLVRSFSGHGRALWSLEEPVPVDKELLREFCKVAFRDLKAKRLAAGFEQEESSRAQQYFEVGQWSPSGGVIPKATAWGWLAEAAGKIKWAGKGVSIPFGTVREEARRRFGDAALDGGWDAFEPGARCNRFWEPGADAKSVIVTETGCVAFTGDKPFLSWSDILGAAWVREQHGGMIGEAIAGLWWDENSNAYWRVKGDGFLGKIGDKADLRLHLTMLGLSDDVAKGERHSDVDRAIYTIQMHRSVRAVAPLIFRTGRVVDGVLNISRARPLTPSPDQTPWGSGFPWLSSYFERLFGPDQLQWFLAWFAHFYGGAVRGEPGTGMALSIAGPNSIGKTFLGNAVLGPMVGGHRDASRYLCGEDQFNSMLLDAPLWTLHDAVMGNDPRAKEKFSQNLKRAVANREVHARGMYREGVDVPWCGRVFTTMNLDPDSLRMLPSLEITIQEKLLLLKANDPGVGRFPTDEEVGRELPFFGAFLRDFEIPDDMRSDRFGVRHWHHPDLVEASQVESPTHAAYEILHHWRHNYFQDGSKTTDWVGTATQLLAALFNDPETGEIARRQFKNCNALGNAVTKLIGQGVEWLAKERVSGHGRDRVIRVKK